MQTYEPIIEAEIEIISVGDRMRSLNQEVVDKLKESIRAIGLKTPISVRDMGEDEGWELVTGLHRLEAAKQLGWTYIDAREETGSEDDAKMWEIAENLHRAELTALERAEHIDQWIKLSEAKEAAKKEADGVSAQVGPKLSARGRAGEGRPQGGINAAVRKLGITRQEGQRSVRRAERIVPEVRDEIRDMPEIADSGVELDALAKTPPEQQAAVVAAVKTGKAKTVREATDQAPREAKPPKNIPCRTSEIRLWRLR
jgi:ParB family transcriptional regulator, chromosome partitioning protein